MPDASFITRGERAFLAGAVLAALLVGGAAGYAAYEDEAEAQFHGGVLPEDVREAQLALWQHAASAFVRWGAGIVLLVGGVPFAARRMLKRAIKSGSTSSKTP